MTEGPAESAASTPAGFGHAEREAPPARRDEVATRASFIDLEQGVGDRLANWLCAERELLSA